MITPKIAYLVNQYPKVSHSFIRREILALESLNIPVVRFSIRRCQEELVDPADQKELEKTFFLLSVGIFGLLLNLLAVALTYPLSFLKALILTLNIGWKSERGLLINLAYLAEACVLRQKLADLDIEHLHAHFGTNSTTVAMLCKVLGGPNYSFTVHGPEEFDNPKAIALPVKIEHATFVVAISYYGQSQLYRWCDYAYWSKIKIIHCGVNPEFFNLSVSPIPQQPRLVCVGRLCPQKGQILLIEATKELIKQGIEFKLVLVGDGEDREIIEKLIKQNNLENYIEITGWANNQEVQEQILAAKALVLPSFAEGLPVVIMESFALRRPVLSTYIAGIPELLIPDVCGWLIPAGSTFALSTAMKNILNLPLQQLEEMGRLGQAIVKQNHDVLTESKKLAHLFIMAINNQVL